MADPHCCRQAGRCDGRPARATRSSTCRLTDPRPGPFTLGARARPLRLLTHGPAVRLAGAARPERRREGCGDPGAAAQDRCYAPSGRPPKPDWADRALIAALARLAPRALRGDRPRPGLLRGPGRVHRARTRRDPGRDLGGRHAREHCPAGPPGGCAPALPAPSSVQAIKSAGPNRPADAATGCRMIPACHLAHLPGTLGPTDAREEGQAGNELAA